MQNTTHASNHYADFVMELDLADEYLFVKVAF